MLILLPGAYFWLILSNSAFSRAIPFLSFLRRGFFNSFSTLSSASIIIASAPSSSTMPLLPKVTQKMNRRWVHCRLKQYVTHDIFFYQNCLVTTATSSMIKELHEFTKQKTNSILIQIFNKLIVQFISPWYFSLENIRK